MPKVKWCKPVPPPNMLRDLFNRYQKAQGLSSVDLGKRLGIQPESVRRKKMRGVWSNEDIRAWCKALNITNPEEVGKAILFEW
jgi:hypothetical protein